MFSGVLTTGCLPRGFLFAADAVSHPQQWSTTTRNTVVLMNVEVPTKYLLSQNNNIVIFEICLQSKDKTLRQPVLHSDCNALRHTIKCTQGQRPHVSVPLTAMLPKQQVFVLYFVQGSPVELQTPTHVNLINHSMTTSPPVLSPSSILLPPFSLCLQSHNKSLVHISIFFF